MMTRPIQTTSRATKSAAGVRRAASAKARTGVEDRYLVPALIRGIEILQTLSNDRRKLSLSEIAAGLAVTRSSAYRLLYTLTHLGFVEFDSEAKTYALSPKVLHLGYLYLASRDLVEIAMPYLVRLRDSTGWSAHLGELQGRDVLYLARVATHRSIASTVRVGTLLPANSTAMGRVLLSGLSEMKLRELYVTGDGSVSRGRPGINLPALKRQLDSDRLNGVVVQNGLYEPGVASVAAPIYDVGGQLVAAINISVVSLLATDADLNGRFRSEVLAAARAISEELGWRVPHNGGSARPERRTAKVNF